MLESFRNESPSFYESKCAGSRCGKSYHIVFFRFVSYRRSDLIMLFHQQLANGADDDETMQWHSSKRHAVVHEVRCDMLSGVS